MSLYKSVTDTPWLYPFVLPLLSHVYVFEEHQKSAVLWTSVDGSVMTLYFSPRALTISLNILPPLTLADKMPVYIFKHKEFRIVMMKNFHITLEKKISRVSCHSFAVTNPTCSRIGLTWRTTNDYINGPSFYYLIYIWNTVIQKLCLVPKLHQTNPYIHNVSCVCVGSRMPSG